MSKRNAVTRKIELVETHNISLSLARIWESGKGGSGRVNHAIYHAICMSYFGLCFEQKKKIREALELP